jgi:hypothetical protein
MKVLVFVKATPNSEKGIFPPDTSKLFADMGKFNEQLAKAGILQDADGLKPSSSGKRVKFSDTEPATVIDGPFAETKELVAGYWVWTVKSMDEAMKWAKLCPNPMPGEEGTIEVRPCYSIEDFADIAPKEEFERELRIRKVMAGKAKSKTKGKAKAKAKAKAKPAPARGKSSKKKARPAKGK